MTFDFKIDLVPVLIDIEKMFLEIGTVYPETVYQNAVKIIFQLHGFQISSEIPVVYSWRNTEIGSGRYDIVASKNNDVIIIELKATTNKKCKWSEICQLKKYMFHGQFKHGIIINFPQIENHRETGIYFYSLLNCLWLEKEELVKTALKEHICIIREYTANEIEKNNKTIEYSSITFTFP